jgi:hypothetical protein
MAIRSEDQLKIVEVFDGVNDAIDKLKLPDKFAPTALGGFFTEKSEFKRVLGKKMVDANSTNPGSILCVKQLEFKDSKVVVYHSSTGYFQVDTSTMVTVLSSTSSVNPLGSLVL